MPSSINPAVIVDGVDVVKADLRTQFATAKSEIEALQAGFGAWSSYSPTVTATSGTLTTVTAAGSFVNVDKLVMFRVLITLTTNGTGAGELRCTLPAASRNYVPANGLEINALGLVQVRIPNTASYCAIYTAANAYPGADGRIFAISGVYEKL